MLVYIDMDGVLSDLDGAVSRRANIPPNRLLDFREERSQAILESIQALGEKHWTGLKPLNKADWRERMVKWKSYGHELEILTSYGIRGPLQVQGAPLPKLALEALAHKGKADWMWDHYGELFEFGVLSNFNGVGNCHLKARLAGHNTLLIDDQWENVEEFRRRGGDAILYSAYKHDSIMAMIEEELTP